MLFALTGLEATESKKESSSSDAPGGPDQGPNVQSGAQQNGDFQGNY